MTRSEYMDQIKTCLRRLPKQDFEQALEYFYEYFEEAGPDQEARAIEDLGEPKAAAEQILRNLVICNAEESGKKSIKRSLDSVWIGILAICAAPVALPLAFALAVTVLSLLVSVVAVVGSFLMTGGIMAAVSVIPMFGGIYLLGSYPASGIMTLGIGLMLLGIGLLVSIGCVALGRLCLGGLTKMIGFCMKKPSPKNLPGEREGAVRHDEN